MVKVDELKKLIADTLKVNPTDIDDVFNLKTGKLMTSAGSVILSNIVKKVYGVKVDCKKVFTFGDLTELVNDGLTEPSKAMSIEEIAKEAIQPQEVPVRGRLVCGIDIQEIDIFPFADDYWKESFYTDNFTKNEIAYCVTASSPRHSFAARWCVKEALHKCGSKYYNIPLSEIQIVKQMSGAIILEVLKENKWIRLPFSCSLSHAENYAVGMVTGFEQ